MIVVSVAASGLDELRANSSAAFDAGAQAVEVRADFLPDPDPARARECVSGAAVYTLRPAREGGRYDGPEEARLAALRAAAASGFEFVDVEHDAAIGRIEGARVIRSIHLFEGPPAQIDRLVASMASTRPAIVKIASFCADAAQEAVCVAAQRRFGSAAAIFGFGPSAIASRILGLTARAPLLYASMGPGFETAPGQPDLAALLGTYSAGSIGQRTEIFGIAGDPVSHSRSPAFHNRAFGLRGTDAVYLPFLCPDFGRLWAARAALGFRGLSVTMPHKEAALRVADFASADARRAGCANTLTLSRGRWRADNTDVPAVGEALESRMGSLRGKKALVLGSGGAARGCLLALASAGAEVTIAARNDAGRSALAAEFGVDHRGLERVDTSGYEAVINATSVGMPPRSEQSPVDASRLVPGQTVLDMVYGPESTALAAGARARGCAVIDGAEVFERQAELQQRIWSSARS